MSHWITILPTLFFLFAILHTFLTPYFHKIAARYPEGSVKENLFQLLGEVEVVFGLWAGLWILVLIFLEGGRETIHRIENLSFAEPAFVFVILSICATRPMLFIASSLIQSIAKIIPITPPLAVYFTALTIGPLLGSFITEPAAMTLIAILIKKIYFDQNPSPSFKYATLAILFVNISIGGVLTPYAAPPVIMVAKPWGWDLSHLFFYFGWKSILAIFINTALAIFIFRKELKQLKIEFSFQSKCPTWLMILHLCFLFLVVKTAHHPVIFAGLFLFFLGVVSITREYQDELRLKENLLVGFFLAGLVVLGSFQGWWLEPLIASLSPLSLFLGSTFLTAFVDNAALTYLGTQVDLNPSLQYALLAGALAGGGLTVIANAPNPAGFSILKPAFEPEGIRPVRLFLYALLPTLVTLSCFWLL